jgi:type I restriction enzyme, S subunit
MSVKTLSQPLHTIVKLDKGKSPVQQPYYGPSAVHYLTPEYLRGIGGAEKVKPCTNAIFVNSGETIILWDGSNAGEILRAREGMLASTMMRVRHNEDYIPEYFFYALKSWENYLKAQTSGSGIPHVDKEILGNIRLFNCSKPEQSKISEILSKVDRAIEQTEVLIAKQQRIKTGLMQDLLTRGIDKDGNIRSEKTHKFWDSPLGRIPVDWGVVPLRQVTEAIIDCPHSTPKFIESGIFVIRTFNLKDGRIVGDHSYISEKEYQERISRLKPQTDDIVFTREAPVGEAITIPPNLTTCLGQRTMLIRCDKNKCIPGFLIEIIYSQPMRIRFDQMVGGTTNPHLNVGVIRELQISIPKDVKEQNQILEKLSSSNTALDFSLNNLEKLKRIKTGLMQDLLTGNVPVTPLINKAETPA